MKASPRASCWARRSSSPASCCLCRPTKRRKTHDPGAAAPYMGTVLASRPCPGWGRWQQRVGPVHGGLDHSNPSRPGAGAKRMGRRYGILDSAANPPDSPGGSLTKINVFFWWAIRYNTNADYGENSRHFG